MAYLEDKLTYWKSKYRSFMANRTKGDDLVEAVNQAQEYLDFTITSAEMLALFATPKTIIPAQGANTIIMPTGVALFLDYNSAAYAGVAAGEDLTVRHIGAATRSGVSDIETTGFLDQASDQYAWTPFDSTWSYGLVNTGIEIALLTGEVTTGDSPLYGRIFYKTLRSDIPGGS